ncbi:MAG: ATP-binding cassette domain-containing protein [Aquabacterium sp.]|nr:MAG: ATP-binding cassette domain-containing protein [Aquabacterium sp.]
MPAPGRFAIACWGPSGDFSCACLGACPRSVPGRIARGMSTPAFRGVGAPAACSKRDRNRASPGRGSVLEIDDVRVERPGFVLHLARQRLDAGSLLTIVGPSGGGKSTLLRALLGLEPRASVRGLRWKGRDLHGLPPHRRPFAWMPQDLGLWPHLDALEHLAFARSRGARLRAVDEDHELLRQLGIGHRAHARPSSLSAGERQRLAFARVMAQQPQWAVLDEPFSHLDPVLAEELGHAFFAIARERGMGLVLVSHHIGRHQRSSLQADPFWVIENGGVTQCGGWQDIARAPATPWIERFVDLHH